MSTKRDYDSTVARIAGNIAAGMVSNSDTDPTERAHLVTIAVKMARDIVAEVKRTEPVPDLRNELG